MECQNGFDPCSCEIMAKGIYNIRKFFGCVGVEVPKNAGINYEGFIQKFSIVLLED